MLCWWPQVWATERPSAGYLRGEVSPHVMLGKWAQFSFSFFPPDMTWVCPKSLTSTPAETILKANRANPQSGHDDFTTLNSNPILSRVGGFLVGLLGYSTKWRTGAHQQSNSTSRKVSFGFSDGVTGFLLDTATHLCVICSNWTKMPACSPATSPSSRLGCVWCAACPQPGGYDCGYWWFYGQDGLSHECWWD